MYNVLRHNKTGRKSFLATFGPAWIVMIADVDVASIVTGIQSGASFGFHLIFIELILTVPLAVIQYVSGSIAIATGKGIAESIRGTWGPRYAYLSAIPMALTDFLSYVTEYAGIAIGFLLLGLNPAIGILIAFVLHNILVMTKKFETVERPLLIISVVLVASFVIAAIMSTPNLHDIVFTGLNPVQPYGNPDYTYLAVANIGAVIMPWMIFYQAGASVEKKLPLSSLGKQKRETYIGALVSELIMVAIIISSAKIGSMGALNLGGLAATFSYLGSMGHILMAVGFISAAFLALVVISLSSAWGVCEAAGIKFRFSDKISNRKGFYTIFLLESFPAMILSIVASSGLIPLMLNLMVIYVIVDIPVLIMVGLITRKQKMVQRGLLSKKTMAAYWAFFILIEAMGIYSLLTSSIAFL